MGPGRLTGMNAGAASADCTRSPSPRCFNGARSIDRDERAHRGAS